MQVFKDHEIVDFIIALFDRRGAEEYMGEAVSMASHMQQAAACAVADDADDDLIIAALLHDLGHFVGDFPIGTLESGIDNFHAEAGARFLEPYFPPAVTEPIRLHVAAKKYLCAIDVSYLKQLSPASINSLQAQGGPMKADEITAFETHPYHQTAIQTRLYDDTAKVEYLQVPSVHHYRAQLISLLT